MPPRRESRLILWIAIGFIVFGGLLIGSRQSTLILHGVGFSAAYLGVHDWCVFWDARDRYREWRDRYKR